MGIKQISVFLENNPGRIADVTEVIAAAGVNLRAISVADTADFGILRLIVDKQKVAVAALLDKGFRINETEILVTQLDDKPGALARVMSLFSASEVNIEYLYASLEQRDGKAVVIFKVKDLAAGRKILLENSIPVVENF
jgi:hypothetical protein